MNVVVTLEKSGCPICFPSVYITACYCSTVTQCVLGNLLSPGELLIDITDNFTSNHCRTPQSIFYDKYFPVVLKYVYVHYIILSELQEK